MALKKTWDAVNERVHYQGEHVVFTGQATGYVTLADGSVVDVTDPFVAADSPEHALAISDAIGARFAAEGHPAHRDGTAFVHTPSAVSHTSSGKPAPAFAKAVEAAVPAGKDSSPQAVLDSLSKKG
jgi:hypothetical protein